MKLTRGPFYYHIHISFQPRVARIRTDFRITRLDRSKLLRQVAWSDTPELAFQAFNRLRLANASFFVSKTIRTAIP
jgi:hypothetical protein